MKYNQHNNKMFIHVLIVNATHLCKMFVLVYKLTLLSLVIVILVLPVGITQLVHLPLDSW